jgi:hypothetical protein
MNTVLSKTKLEQLTPFELKYYIERGNLKVMEIEPIPPRPTRIEDTDEFKKHAELIGTPIHLAEASRKYKIALATLSRWVGRGLIKKFPNKVVYKNKIMLDEAYVAYAAEVFKSRKYTKGRWLFDTDGTPYIKTSR